MIYVVADPICTELFTYEELLKWSDCDDIETAWDKITNDKGFMVFEVTTPLEDIVKIVNKELSNAKC